MRAVTEKINMTFNIEKFNEIIFLRKFKIRAEKENLMNLNFLWKIKIGTEIYNVTFE